MMNNVPKLRFREFSGESNKYRIDSILERYSNPVQIEEDIDYREIGVRSHGKGIFHKELTNSEKLGNKRVFWVHPNAFIVNIVFAWEHAVALTSDNEDGLIASHRFPMYIPKDDLVDLKYLLHYFLKPYGKYLLELASPGGAGRNKTLGQSNFNELKIYLPSKQEQQKIASFLTSVDTKIEQLTKKEELLKQYKKGTMQKIFLQEIRFKADDGSEFPKWEKKSLEEILKYEQPTKYIVKSTEYDDSYQTPVLTAGKTFILGFSNEKKGIFTNTPVIIFDDFTTSNNFVNFHFKVKSSAMKILKLKSNVNADIKLIYEFIQNIKFPIGEHKRYWISEYQYMDIPFPCIEEQTKIANFLSCIDSKIEQVRTQLEATKNFKKGLLQQMFV